MKLSEAIRMNGMMKPQGFGPRSIASFEAPCALGGALQSIGRQITDQGKPNYDELVDYWPWVKNICINPCCPSVTGVTYGLIWHLNDVHRWTRQQIADWVATIEPQEVGEEIEQLQVHAGRHP